MPRFTVRIETSVSIYARDPQDAVGVAAQYAKESLGDSNAIAKVYQDSKKNKLGKKVLTQEL